ncbi:MAG TPA: DUF308 domain-containing protein [Rickettsiales bacterium]|nr:DUF308 domain-containing protein [Rickettsiales bacterium]
MLFTRTAMTIDMGSLGARLEEELRQHKGKYILQGILFILAGTLAAMIPTATALSAELLLGVIILGIGALQLMLTLRARMHWWSLLSSILSIAIGLIMIWKPLPVLLTFVTLLAIFMTLEGIFELFLAFQFRPLRNWGWMLFSGTITLLLALLLWIGFPAFDILYMGWIIAANLLLYGVSLLMLVWRVSP